MRFRPWRPGRLAVVAMLLSAACVGPTSQSETTTRGSVADRVPTSNTTVTTTAETSVGELFEWPTVVAEDFIRTSSGPVGGVRTYDSVYGCLDCVLTVLDDGRVLKVGPSIAHGMAAEVWDPVTGLWTTVGTPNGFRGFGEGYPSGVLLEDGRVLVVGLVDPHSTRPDVELFDPRTGSFGQLAGPHGIEGYGDPPQVGAVQGSGVVRLSDGRVFISSGSRGGYIFDPVDGSWRATGRRAEAPLDGAVLLADGRALLVLGSSLSIYDPTTDGFSGAGQIYPVLSNAYSPPAVVTMADGRVLITGGELEDPATFERSALADAVVFDPVLETVTPVGPMHEPRAGHSAVGLDDGRVVIIGGGAGDRVEVFDPATDSFRPASVLSQPRHAPSVVALQGGNFLVVGGVDHWHRFYANDLTTPLTAEVYHPDGSPSTTSAGRLSGLVLGIEIEELPVFSPGSGWASARIVVPPVGLAGALRAQLTSVDGDGDGEFALFFSERTPPPDWWGNPVFLPVDCDEGCEIKQSLGRLADLRGPFSVHLHIQYAGEIPSAATDMTLTIEVAEAEGS